MNNDHLDRRDFLSALSRYAGGSCLACGMGATFPRCAWGQPVDPSRREVDYYEPGIGSEIECQVCPRHCVLSPGELGQCLARINIAGRHVNRAYANPCILSVDAIEKLPLNHFRPGSKTLTIAVGGCNLRCLYCQNWQHSQREPQELKTFDLPPAEAVAAARKKGIDTIAFSYTEPIAFLEYAKDIAIEARRAGLKVVVASGGYVEPEPLVDLAQHVDAFAISLKGFTEAFYDQVVGARLAPVLRAIESIKRRTDCWLELINVVVPTYNDDPTQIREMCEWVRGHLDRDVPVHFARFVPKYRLANLPRTAVPTLDAACDMARESGLRYVYTSNIAPHEGTNTTCAKCGDTAIQRLGFKVLDNKLQRGTCRKCRHRLPGVWR